MNDDEALPDEDTVECLGCERRDVTPCGCGYCEYCIADMVPEAIAAHQENCGPDEDTHPRRMER